MKRFFLVSTAVPALLLGLSATANAEPAILYIPTEDVTLRPLSITPCPAQTNAALGCSSLVQEETVITPYADVPTLAAAMRAALTPYAVTIISGGADARPPEYVPYGMLLPTDAVSESESNFSCTAGGINCGARKRNFIITTNGGSAEAGDAGLCTDPEPITTALYAFGRASGLEGTQGGGVMNYPPTFDSAPETYADECVAIVPQNFVNDEGMVETRDDDCISTDHVECTPEMPAEDTEYQNSHLDLLAVYGERPAEPDTTAPEIAITAPEPDAVFEAGASVTLEATVADDSDLAAGRWTLTSPALEEAGQPGGVLTRCTNADVCDLPWNDANPWKPTDSSWDVTSSLPAGEYTATFEAADIYGNVAETQTVTFTVEGASSDDGGSVDETGGGVDPDGDGGAITGGDTGTSGGGEDDTAGADDDAAAEGCSCTQSSSPRGGAAFAFLGLLGLGMLRRRRG